MRPQRKPLLIFLALFLVVDLICWLLTYQTATAPSLEQQRAAAPLPTAVPSQVQKHTDNFQQTLSLNGTWRYRQTGGELADYFAPEKDVSDWHTIELPQNWYLAGLNYHGVIWFRRNFAVDAGWQGRAIQLQFNGVDYFADVWLNGQKLGRHEGYFQPFQFDVHEALRYGQTNTLVVRVESPYELFPDVWPHRKTLIKGSLTHDTNRPGNAWQEAGQEYNTGGIWNDIQLSASSYLTIDQLQLQAQWPDSPKTDPNANLEAHVLIDNHTNQTVEAELTLTLSPDNFNGPEIVLPAQTVTLPGGQTDVTLSGPAENPQLWWPWDRGAPNLYTARLTVIVDDNLISEKTTSFGFREITVDQNWAWTLNGERFFPRGTGYMSSQWLSQTDAAWFERDLQQIRAANLNFVRVQAHVEPTEFYEAADKAGILVWQDFPLQWGYSDAPAFIDNAQSQLGDMINLLYNHPGIVVWNIHTESPWATPEIVERNPDPDRRQNQRLDETLQAVAAELDPTRYIHLQTSNEPGRFLGWEYGEWQDYNSNLPGTPFLTAYGAQALPSLAMLEQFLEPEEIPYDTQFSEVRARWRFHNFQENETFDFAKIKQGEAIETFIANSQAYQANLIQVATEAYRRAKYNPMQGLFYAHFVDSWPSISYAVLDYERQPKAGFFALQTAMQPILPSIAAPTPVALEGRTWVYTSTESLEIALWVVNDTLSSYPAATLSWQFAQIDETMLADGTMTGRIGADESRFWTTIDELPTTPGSYRLSVTIRDENDQILGENQFWFVIKDEEVADE